MTRETVTDDERKFFYAGKRFPTVYLEYLNYLRTVKKLATGSIQNRKSALGFLSKFPNKNPTSSIGSLRPSQIQDYTVESAHGISRH